MYVCVVIVVSKDDTSHAMAYSASVCMKPECLSADWQVTVCDPVWHVSSRSDCGTCFMVGLNFLYNLSFLDCTISDLGLHK